jgi:hypothetical protein
MLRLLFLYTIGKLIAWPIRRRFRRFDALAENPQAVQEALLLQTLQYHAGTQFGRDHHFNSIRTVTDFRKHVPIAPYEYYSPYIERVKRGETSALLADPKVLMFALTSGTTASRKFIPVTERYLADYRRGWNMWGQRAMRAHRRDVSLKPIVQLVGDPDEFRTEADIPCGSISGFTAQIQKRLIRFLYCVPPCTGRIKDATARAYVALRFSLPRDVGMFLCANPSTLVQLARSLDQQKLALIKDLAAGTLHADLDIPPAIRAELQPRLRKHRELARRLDAHVQSIGRLYPKDVWQGEKTLIGAWTGGSVGPYLRQLPTYYGNTYLRDIGLIASEGRFTIPVQNDTPAGVLDISTHYYEFIPEDEIDSKQPTVLGAHELIEGRHYYILPTTPHGLYRYDIRDVVKVTGFYGRTPLLQFLGKGNYFSNLTGEKISEHHVTRAMEASVRTCGFGPGTYALAPIWDDRQPYYGLFVERDDSISDAKSFLIEFERQLQAHNSEYAGKRESQRLGPVRLEVLQPGFWQQWDRDRLERSGGVPEQYKHPCLIGDMKFRTTAPVEHEVAVTKIK